jgi:hypothetical protein
VQALKVLVIVMGLAIFAVIGVIIVTVVQRIGGGSAKTEGFGEVRLAVPPGCTLAQVEAGEGRLVMRLDGPPGRGCQQAVVLDAESGEELGRITVPHRGPEP